MKAAVLTATRQVEIQELPIPEIGSGEVLIRVRAAGICGAELHAFIGTHPLRKPPVQMGHEMAGDVVDVGDGVIHLTKGDRVSVFPLRHCGSCSNCKEGMYNLCKNLLLLGTSQWPGPFAEYITAPENLVFKVPSHVTHQEAAIAEPLCVAIHAVNRIGTLINGTVAILGVGTIGLASVVAAREAGAERIFVTDIMDFNLEVANRFGTSLAVNTNREDPVAAILEATDGRGVDAVLIAAGFSSVFNQAIKMVRPQGKVVTIALFDDVVTIEQPNAFVMGEKTITSSWAETHQDFIKSIDIIATGKFRFEDFITHQMPLEKTKEGLELFEKRHEDFIKIMIVME